MAAHQSFTVAEILAADVHTGDFRIAFEDTYLREFGFCQPTKVIRIDDIRVRATGHSTPATRSVIEKAAGHCTETEPRPLTSEQGPSRRSIM